jgi:phage-related protein
MKPIRWVGNSKQDVLAFPATVRREAGYQLSKVQSGEAPDDWKPMPDIGTGVEEIRLRDDAGAYRVIYIARFSEAVYVLHAFRKKTQKTAVRDLDLARQRLKCLKSARS